MKSACRLALVLICPAFVDTVASEITLNVDPPATTQVKLAAQRLERYLGQHSSDPTGQIIVELLDPHDSSIGDQGYALSSQESDVYVHANTETGLANGIYTLLRNLMIEDLASPFERPWDLREKPCYRWRSMMVAPCNFGAAHGFSVFSPDLWATEHWKQYLDYLRLLNVNVVGIYRLGQPGTSKQDADAIKARMFAETSKRYILQGFGGTDYQWVPEARMYFEAFIRMWTPPPPPPADREAR